MRTLIVTVMLAIVSILTIHTGYVNKKDTKLNAEDSISVVLYKLNQQVIDSNLKISKRVIKKIYTTDSINRQYESHIDSIEKKLEKSVDTNNLLKRKIGNIKPKVIIKERVIEKVVEVEKRKNFWGKEKVDTVIVSKNDTL
ncbi:MAG: hypothetical protein LBM02_10090 [Lachnospiraceae bacterium]|jgi:hypothetical protein|nr:hypothetical protein [Lachnospiraceae bacterium]